MKLYDCFVVFLHGVNGILGAGSYGIAMAKQSSYIKNICSYIETAGNKCHNNKKNKNKRAGWCQAGLCAMK